MKSVATWAPAIVFTLVAAGILFEQIGQRQDRARYARVGRAVDIGGRTLNIYCSGEGQPAVVLLTFSHMAGFAWNAVQPRVAGFTHACWYDRAGYGWSDPAPGEPTMRDTASDLHALLHAAGVPLPVVMLGTGDAASEVRLYHGMYPQEVAGVVFVGANGTDDGQEIPESAKGPWAKMFGVFAGNARGAGCIALPMMADAGALRLSRALVGPRVTPAFDIPPEQRAELDFLSDNPEAARGGTVCAREGDMRDVRNAGSLGSLPLIVLAARSSYSGAGLQGTDANAWNKHQDEVVQPGLAALSTRGRLVMQDHRPTGAEVVQAIRRVVTDVRGR